MKGKLFPKIHDLKTLWQAWNRVKKKGAAGGIDGVSIAAFEQNLERNLKGISQSLERGTYVPEPTRRVYVPKTNPEERRALALPAIKDKIVQEATRSTIEPLFNPTFLDFSYAYRPGKGPQKAIGRVEHHLQQKRIWSATSDIDNFFDSINHSLLLKYISQKIWEEEILRLIELWLKMGVVHEGKWIDVEQGVLQGNVISPLLSNIYLHSFDLEMNKRRYALVRYADDFIFLEKTKDEVTTALREAKSFLEKELLLQLNPESSAVRTLHDGFVFLGFLFKGSRKTISAAKLEKIQARIREILRGSSNLSEAIESLNDSIAGWRNYYEVGDTRDQFQFLEDFLFHHLRLFLVKMRSSSDLKEKKMREELQRLEFLLAKDHKEKQKFISLLIAGSRADKIGEARPKRGVGAVAKDIAAQKRRYEKILAEDTDLVVSTLGSFVGKTSRRVVVREKGKKVKEIPFFRLKNILITSAGASFSSDLVKYCAGEGIPITFFDSYGRPYAQVLSPKSPLYRLSLSQVMASTDGKGVHLAKCFAEGKIKNQINLLKYYRKYKARKEAQFAQKFQETIEGMGSLLEKLNKIARGNDLESIRSRIFAVEGQSAAYYWGLIKLLLSNDVYFEGRERRGATDLVNSLLNYGYGILYSQVYQAIIIAGLNPNISFLHKEQVSKPTLVFDLIEEFRQPIVDKAVIGMIRKRQKLTMTGANLSEETKTKVIEAVMKRMNSKVNFRGKKLSLREVIKHQADLIAGFLEDKGNYRPFIDKW
ncbi:MAG TPA: group II intron reverse transcriptase/maturase [Candidatus Latescibacteria bacterium]|nr:group II intron reverse transcriptase/maturase [Candidatus Latescibacterota bacterium]